MKDAKEENDAMAGEGGNGGGTDERGPKKKMKHRKEKPWDTDDIEHWKVEKFDPEWNPSGMLEESSFATLFPAYRGRETDVAPYYFRIVRDDTVGCRINAVGGPWNAMHKGLQRCHDGLRCLAIWVLPNF